MRLNVLFREENESMKFSSKSLDEIMNVSFGELQTLSKNENDYNNLQNKPIINSVVLQGELTAESLGLGRVYYDTTANWNAQPNLIAERGVVYIYSDYTYIEDEVGNHTEIAGIKIGDGSSYLIDMPFVSDATTYLITMHIANADVHTSRAEKEFWNNKVSAYIDHQDSEGLVLSKTTYELNGEIIEVG